MLIFNKQHEFTSLAGKQKNQYIAQHHAKVTHPHLFQKMVSPSHLMFGSKHVSIGTLQIHTCDDWF